MRKIFRGKLSVHCAGWPDRVGKRVRMVSDSSDKDRKANAVRYQACMVNETVFLHRSSSVCQSAPEFAVYNELKFMAARPSSILRPEASGQKRFGNLLSKLKCSLESELSFIIMQSIYSGCFRDSVGCSVIGDITELANDLASFFTPADAALVAFAMKDTLAAIKNTVDMLRWMMSCLFWFQSTRFGVPFPAVEA
ncbi:hypothetical protein ACLOJK_018290 [Asimina triloba]